MNTATQPSRGTVTARPRRIAAADPAGDAARPRLPRRAVLLHGLHGDDRPQLRQSGPEGRLHRVRQLSQAGARGHDLLELVLADDPLRRRRRDDRVPARLRTRLADLAFHRAPAPADDSASRPNDAGAGRRRPDLAPAAAGRLRHGDPLSARRRPAVARERGLLVAWAGHAHHHRHRRLAVDAVRDADHPSRTDEPAALAVRGRDDGRRRTVAAVRRHPAAAAETDHRAGAAAARHRRLQGVRQGLHHDRRRAGHGLGTAVDLRLPRELQDLESRLRRGGLVHGLSRRAHPVLGLLQGRLLEVGSVRGARRWTDPGRSSRSPFSPACW